MPESVNENNNKSHQVLLEAAVQLLRHLAPKDIEKNLNLISAARPEIAKSLKEIVDVPSKIISASGANGREFLSFEATKVDGFYRCPWDDKFYTIDGQMASQDAVNIELSSNVKALQSALNEAVRTYANLYYGSEAITTVLIKENCEENVAFIAYVLIKKSTNSDEDDEISSDAVWDSVHVFKVKKCEEAEGEFVYCHSATVILSFENSVENLKNISLSGNLIHHNEVKASIEADFSKHLVNIGSMVEESEGRLRNDLQSIYFGRTHDIVNEIRQAVPDGFLRNQADFRDEMMSKLASRG